MRIRRSARMAEVNINKCMMMAHNPHNHSLMQTGKLFLSTHYDRMNERLVRLERASALTTMTLPSQRCFSGNEPFDDDRL